MLKKLVAISSMVVVLFATNANADFTIENLLVEIGVSAGENSDGYGNHAFTTMELEVMDGAAGMTDYQLARATFDFGVDEIGMDTYSLRYFSDVYVETGGQGTASSLGNGIIVFELHSPFEVVSTDGDSTLFDALGNPIDLPQNDVFVFEPGRYSLTFGASAAIQSNATEFTQGNTTNGIINFTQVIPEPSAGVILISSLLIGLRRKR